MAYHFFVRYAQIDCELSEKLRGHARKRHQKAYGDLMYLLTERKALVEQYFNVPVTDEAFSEFCVQLYHEGGTAPEESYVNDIVRHHPYSLGCCLTDEALKLLYNCFVAHNVFKDLTPKNLKALFDGSLTTSIKCVKATRLGYIMHHLSVAGIITGQYQKAIGNCGYIIAPSSDKPMTAESMKDAVKRAKVYSGEDNVPWKRTVDSDLRKLFDLTGAKDDLLKK